MFGISGTTAFKLLKLIVTLVDDNERSLLLQLGISREDEHKVESKKLKADEIANFNVKDIKVLCRLLFFVVNVVVGCVCLHFLHMYVSLFNFVEYEERKACFNWQNTRPLEAMRNYKRKKLCVRDLLNQEIRLYYFKNHVDDSEYQQSYFGTKLVMKIASGLS